MRSFWECVLLFFCAVPLTLGSETFNFEYQPSPDDPSKITLPSRDTSMLGSGITWSHLQNKGAFVTQYPIPTVPWFNLPFSLSLVYNSQGHAHNTLANHWELSIPYIQIHARMGVPHYEYPVIETPGIYSSLDEELALLDSETGEFRPKVDTGFRKYIFRPGTHAFEMTSPEGVVFVFGGTEESRISTDNQHTYGWMLSEIRNQFNQRIILEYSKEHHFPKIQHIRFLTHRDVELYHIAFNYEAREDQQTSFRYGFRTYIDKRLKRIDCYYLPEGNWTNKKHQREIVLHYIYSPIDGHSVLERIQQMGFDERGRKESLPEVSYKTNSEWSFVAKLINTEVSLPDPIGKSNPLPIDWNGDGVTDLLSKVDSDHLRVFLQTARRGFTNVIDVRWTGEDIHSQNVQFADVNGDRRVDMIVAPGAHGLFPSGYYRTPEEEKWSQPVPFTHPYELRNFWKHIFGDLNRDGKVDAVYYGEATGLNLYFQIQSGLVKKLNFYRESSNYPEILTSGLHHKWIQLADINGDGLSDLAALHILPGGQFRICYSEGTGYGFVSEKKCKTATASSDAAMVLEDVARRKSKQWSLMDVTGDGKADLVAFSDSILVVYIQLPERFSERGVTSFHRDFIKPGDNTSVSFWDANGNGSRDVVISRRGLDDTPYTYHYIDFDENLAQGLLTEISSGHGLTQVLKFKPSTLVCEQDSCHSYLPDVFPLLSEIQTRYWGKEVQRETFNYEGGFYNYKENIFNGFSTVTSDFFDEEGIRKQQFTYDNGSNDQNFSGVLLDSFIYDDQGAIKISASKRYRVVQTNQGYVIRHVISDNAFYHDEGEAVGVNNRHEVSFYKKTNTPKSYRKISEPNHDSVPRSVQITYLQPSERDWLILPVELYTHEMPHLRYHWDMETGLLTSMDQWSQYLTPLYLEKLNSSQNLCRYITEQPPVYEQGWVVTHAFEYLGDRGVMSEVSFNSGLHVSLNYPEAPYDFKPTQMTSEGMEMTSEHQRIVYDWYHHGKVQSYFNARGLKLHYVFDALSRLSEYYERDDLNVPQARYRYHYAQDASAPFSIITEEKKGIALPSFYLFDPMGRKMASAIKLSEDQYRFLDAKKFNSRGEVLEQYQPFVFPVLQGWESSEEIPVTTYRYDVLRRLVSHVLPNGASKSYKYKGLTVDEINPHGNVVHQHINDFQETMGWSYPGESYQTAISRNGWGEIVRLSAGRYPDFQYEYHPQRILWRASNPLSGSVEFGFSKNERFHLKTITDKSERLSGLVLSEHDSKNRVVSQKRINCQTDPSQLTTHELVYGTHESGGNVSDIGLLVQESYETSGYPQITKKYHYDERDRLVRKIIAVNGRQNEYVQKFDAQDRLVLRDTSGASANYHYSSGVDLSRMSVNGSAVELTHSPEGLLTQERLGGFSIRHAYDPQMKWIVNKEAYREDGPLKAYQRNYDPAGNVISESANGVLTTLEYDALERLHTINDQPLIYTDSNDLQFDGRKWFLWFPEAVGSVLGFYKKERSNNLLFEKAPMNFDDLGHITRFGQPYPQYEYDSEGRLLLIHLSKDVRLTYVYYTDSHHPTLRLVANQGKVVRTQVYLDEMGWLDLENEHIRSVVPYEQLGQLWLEGQTEANKTISLTIPDFRGSPATIIPLNGEHSIERNYDVFGWRTANLEEGLTPGYAGQVDDTLAGVAFARHRVYIPMLRRFASMDPLLFSNPEKLVDRPLEYNPYQYSAHNPVTHTDAEGEFVPALILVAAAVKSLAIGYIAARVTDHVNARAGGNSHIHDINEIFKTATAVTIGVTAGLPSASMAGAGAVSGMLVSTGMSVWGAKVQGEGDQGIMRAFGMGLWGGLSAGYGRGLWEGMGVSSISAGASNLVLQTLNRAPGESYDWQSVGISAGSSALGKGLAVGLFGNMKADFLQGTASSVFSGAANKTSHWLIENLQK